jgi:hypothetical protein
MLESAGARERNIGTATIASCYQNEVIYSNGRRLYTLADVGSVATINIVVAKLADTDGP